MRWDRIIIIALAALFAAGCQTVSEQHKNTARTFNTVVVDAGHGGKDSGAYRRFGPPEKAATLDVATFACDVSDPDAVAAAMDRYHREHRAADILVNNAGILYSEPLVRIGAGGVQRHDVAMWNKVLAADLSSVFYMTSHAVERMIATRTRGIVVNISSVSAAGNAGQSAYSAAKAGVNALTATWAKELAAMGIRVAAVAPGFTETESTREAVSDTVLQETLKRVPLRRLGTPDEIAQGVLASGHRLDLVLVVFLFGRQPQAALGEQRGFSESQMLLEVSGPVVLGQHDPAGIGLFLAQDQLEQRRLAVPVSADQPEPLAASHRERRVLEDDLRAVRFGEIENLQHEKP